MGRIERVLGIGGSMARRHLKTGRYVSKKYSLRYPHLIAKSKESVPGLKVQSFSVGTKFKGGKKYVEVKRISAAGKISHVLGRKVANFAPLVKEKTGGFISGSAEKAAQKIIKDRSAQVLRVRVRGKFGGKNRVITSYLRFSQNEKAFKLRRTSAQKIEYIAGRLIRSMLHKIRSMGASFSPENKRDIKFGPITAVRFFAKDISIARLD